LKSSIALELTTVPDSELQSELQIQLADQALKEGWSINEARHRITKRLKEEGLEPQKRTRRKMPSDNWKNLTRFAERFNNEMARLLELGEGELLPVLKSRRANELRELKIDLTTLVNGLSILQKFVRMSLEGEEVA
jgi:transposase InsO family protein